jgi:hypothetical protein
MGWIRLFNGRNLKGWTPKIRGHKLGENWNDTFRVEKGVLCVRYDRYTAFDETFGHLFYKTPFSRYRLRVEYRFLAEQCKGGPGWAWRNSGVMLHSQDPKTMALDQDFPASLELQLLGGPEQGERHTANLCTPGTNVVMDGKLITRHCTDSTSPTFPGDGWVTVEAEVLGGEKLTHLIDGKPVITYAQPQLDPADASAKRLLSAGTPLMLTGGYLCLQAESHPCEFRRVDVLPLK